MPTISRTAKSPDQFELQPLGRSTLLNKIYVGFVKDTRDEANMGRIKVWIPELNGDPNDNASWFLMSYASPFAGATSVFANTAGNGYKDTQRSYGMWFTPPDLDNEVVCCFINGDPGRGVWFACLYQQNMNHMVPGIPGNNSSEGLPVAEYNKMQKDVKVDSPTRPTYTPLADAITEQGLAGDSIRGVTRSGARRENPSQVYGILTPGGSQFVMDDDSQNSFIRLRTQQGAQILVNDSTGEIYMISRTGESWTRLSAEGTIDFFGTQDISIRTESSLNLRADLDVNIEAGRNIYVKARGDAEAEIGNDGGGQVFMNGNSAVQLSSFGNFFISSEGEMHRTSKKSLYDYAERDVHVKAGAATHIQSDSADINLKASSEIHATATNIHFNGPAAIDATSGAAALSPQEFSIIDNALVNGSRQNITRTSILYNMPYHEPYDHSAGIKTGNTNNNVDSVDPAAIPQLKIVRKGEIIANQQRPTNINGTPREGMAPGIYKGITFDSKGIPVYEKVGDLQDLALPAAYTTSNSGLAFVKKTESYKPNFYQDPPGSTTYSIGYGHKLSSEEFNGRYVMINNEKVLINKGITSTEAEELFKQDIKTRGEDVVKRHITQKLTQSQFDALVSFAYNTGDGGFKNKNGSDTGVKKNINSGNYESLPASFMSFIHSNGKVNKGLINRRQKEAFWFLTQTRPPN